MGSSWLSTKITCAPCGVCQCWMASAACADRGRHNSNATQKVLIMADSRHRRAARLGLQSLRVEYAHALLVILQPLLRCGLHLPGAHRTLLFDAVRKRLVRQPRGHVFAQVHL